MSEQLDLIYLPELSMSFSSLKKHLSELYNIQIQKEMSDSKKVRELYDKAYHLFNNYIGNNGKLDYSDKEYGYLVDELEDVEVGYFKDESVDSDYAKRLRDEGFTMTEQEAIDTLQHRIESIEEEVGPVQYAKGGDKIQYRIVWGLGYFEDFDNLDEALKRKLDFIKNPPGWARMPKDTPEIYTILNGKVLGEKKFAGGGWGKRCPSLTNVKFR